ncbi:MAG: Uma2 family endonuclease, partial [Anaerolineae bacterium]|nr:Uma2 family endonuclease [Anaerolineae bacterium]
MNTVQIPVISVDDFVERFANEGPFEYVDGEVIPLTPQIARSSRVGGRLFRKLADYVDEHESGEVFSETPFVLTLGNPNWVKGSRVPDIMFYSAERLKNLAEVVPDWEDKPLIGAPDFVAEVVSPTDRYTEVYAKVAGYLRDG